MGFLSKNGRRGPSFHLLLRPGRDKLSTEMPTHVLVVTPSPSFGELVRRSLEETDGYRVFVVNNKASAIVRADEETCKMVFLDLDMGEQWVEDVGKSLRTVVPDIQLFILAQDETPPSLDSIRPWTLVRKPFQLPELLSTVTQQAQTPSAPAKMETMPGNLPWLNDVSKAAQHLTRLTLESSAQAALITYHDQLWAYAGQLSQEAAQELARTLVRHWSGQKGSDLLRFVRLESTKAEHMLYATELADGMLLAMAFDAETPFSTIRSQAGQLAASFADNTEPKEDRVDKPLWPKNQKTELPAQAISEAFEEEPDADIPPISEILKDIPAPDPKPAPQVSQSMRPAPAGPASNQKRPLEAGQTRPSVSSRESSAAVPLNEWVVAEEQESRIDLTETRLSSTNSLVGDLEVTAPSKSQPRPETPVGRPAPGELDVTRPHSANDMAGRIMLEPATAGVYHLTYACLLVPRFTSHYLTGDIADRISEWLPNICVAFGWRLEYLAVRPEYLQWIVNVPPATSPGYLMRIMRQQTSEKVFTEFLRLKKENPSGDFWAPGYLIMGGSQPHPSQLVRDYIKQIRQRQGLDRPHR
jgi:REP element-mobilizing transposase RayT/DNA-binding response OmpR family regulator